MATQLSFLTSDETRAWRSIRGWLLPGAADKLYHYAFEASPKGSVVEIGSFAGKSTVCIARALRDRGGNPAMTAIDVRFQPDFRDNVAHFGVSNVVRTLELPSLAAADTWSSPISFIYIDGHHGKAHGYADFVVWESMMLPGGVIALDDTAGFMIGPSLQLQAALRTGAYELLTDVGGVTFLGKRRALLSGISDYPLSRGSLMAYVAYISAWSGAMDPTLRLPRRSAMDPTLRLPRRSREQRKRSNWGWTNLSHLCDLTPRQAGRLIVRKLSPLRRSKGHDQIQSGVDEPHSRVKKLGDLRRLLDRLDAAHEPDNRIANTLSYLRACIEIQRRDLDAAIDTLKRLCDLDAPSLLVHYKIDVREMAALRLAQAYDIQGARELATSGYRQTSSIATIPEILHQAHRGLSEPFGLPEQTDPLLLREYVVSAPLAQYRAILPQPE
jgi:hypothetical protein